MRKLFRRKFFRSPLLAAGAALALAAAAGPAAAGPSIVFDLASGQVLEHEDAFARWYPASLSKLMTAYVAFRAVAAGELALSSPIRISKHAAAEPPSKVGFKPGSVLTLDNALKLMLVKSANDIAMAVGENVGGSQQAFAARMNAEARRLGMTGSHWVNPNGLHSPEQYTTARDLALLVKALRAEFPQYASYFTIEGLAVGKTRYKNYNLLIGRYAGADGMKTGFVCASGFNQIGSATRGGRTLVAIALGELSATGRADRAAKLLDQGFSTNAAATATLASLAHYGVEGVATDMRPQVCEKKPAAAQSESGAEAEAAAGARSPWLRKLDPAPHYVAVGLGGATGPVPLALRGLGDNPFASVPIPTWRPDRPAPTGLASANAVD